MDRRSFLANCAALAVGTAVGESQQAEHPIAPPVASGHTEPSREPFPWAAAGMVFSFEFDGDKLRLRTLLPAGVAPPHGLPPPSETSGLETSIHCTGEDVPDHHGAKLSGGSPGTRMRFAGKREEGRRLTLTHEDAALGLRVDSVYQGFDGVAIVRRHTVVTNTGTAAVGLEYVSSAMLTNFASPGTFDQDLRIHFAHNSWQAEAQWRSARPAELGLVQNGNFSVTGALFSTMGSWPCQTFLPMAMVENLPMGVIWFWQVEHNGSWHCELAQTGARALYAYLGGPDAEHAQAWKSLRPGESYSTVPVALGCVRGGFEQAVAELTRYRRVTHLHPRRDMERCPVVFNDVVMLDSDQTAEKELPLIDAAAEAGCEVFCMDAGWTARPGENWWGAVGDWQADAQRFPGGLRPVADRIRARGMVPGLWIEPEVASPGSALAPASDSWFFQRHGRRVLDHSRYHLDFRNGEVRTYVDRVLDRLIEDGFLYIKLDYNINALAGTELGAESFGQGLLGHNRAFLAWLDALLTRHPDLTIETVASGSMRMEHSMLSRAQLQSISDADDYRLYSSLATGASAAVLPEQMGVWSQPLAHDGPEVTSCHMVNAMLGRIHQSGFLPVLAPASKAQVHHGIRVYKEQIRAHIPASVPFYPLGLPDMTQPETPAALGMRAPGGSFAAVWRRAGPAEIRLPWAEASARLLYPLGLGAELRREGASLAIRLPRPQMGCIVSS